MADWGPVQKLMAEAAAGVAPALTLCAWNRGEQAALLCAGQATAETVFDLASLTKPLAAALLALELDLRGALPWSRCLEEIWGPAVPPDKRGITLEMLLTHRAGYPDYRTYFDLLLKHEPSARKPLLKAMLMNEPLAHPPGSETVYSDLGYLLLGLILEETSGRPLEQAVRSVYERLGIKGPAYRPLDQAAPWPLAQVAPCGPLPGRQLVHGEVEDENAHALGGVAGHAGLFGAALQVAGVMDALSRCLQGQGPWPAEQVKRLFTRQGPPRGATRTPGFDTPSPEQSAAGTGHPKGLVGHLGFTGTSFWWSPSSNCGVVLLTNRVALGRENQAIQPFRRRLHSLVWPLLDC